MSVLICIECRESHDVCIVVHYGVYSIEKIITYSFDSIGLLFCGGKAFAVPMDGNYKIVTIKINS